MPTLRPYFLGHFSQHFFHTASLLSNQLNYLNCHINNFLSLQTLNLQTLHQSHALIITSGNATNLFLSSKLISLYASLHQLSSSSKIFHSLPTKDPFLWNSIIQSHFSNKQYSEALDFYVQMRISGALPDQFTVPIVVTACAETSWLNFGKLNHGFVLKLGLFDRSSAVGASFVYMYSKCGALGDACDVFGEMNQKDVVSWTAIIVGCVHNGKSELGLEYFFEMHRIREIVNSRAIGAVLQGCGNSGCPMQGRCLHGLVVKTGMGYSQSVQCSVLSMYSRCGTPGETYLSFAEVSERDLIAWTLVIGVYARLGDVRRCLDMFSELLASDICPDGVVISCVLSGFGNSMRVMEGKAFHGKLLKRNDLLDWRVRIGLLSMYNTFGLLIFAEKFFDRVHERDKEPWNMMVAAYGRVGMQMKSLELFREMQHLGIMSDSSSLVSVITSCSQLGGILAGQSIHCYFIKIIVSDGVSVANSLMELYGTYGNLTNVQRIFQATQQGSSAWNALISSYARNNHFAQCIELFDKMVSEDVNPSGATLVTVLSACSSLSSLKSGEKVHAFIRSGNFKLNVSLSTALIDMYAKCGQLDKSREIFNSVDERDIVSWNVMISSYGMHGDAKSSIETFNQMEETGIIPDALSFLGVLLACSYAGLVEEGKRLFAKMRDYSVTPNLKHYACMVDLLGRSGNLIEAESLVLSMPISPDKGIWGALLNACNIHNETEMAIRIAQLALESDPENDGYYILLSNLYNSLGKWEDADNFRKLMKERGIIKGAGWSTI